MINVQEEKDGSFTISWDANSSTESILNTWTEQDFIDAIMEHCKVVLNEQHSSTGNSKKEN